MKTRHLRERHRAEIFFEVSHQGLAQRLAVVHPSRNERTGNHAIAGGTQQQAEMLHPPRTVDTHGNRLDIHNWHPLADEIKLVGVHPAALAFGVGSANIHTADCAAS